MWVFFIDINSPFIFIKLVDSCIVLLQYYCLYLNLSVTHVIPFLIQSLGYLSSELSRVGASISFVM